MNDVESRLRAHLEDLVWQPPEDTLGRKRLQTQISLCLKDMLKSTMCDDAKKRSWAFEVLQGTSQSWKLSGWMGRTAAVWFGMPGVLGSGETGGGSMRLSRSSMVDCQLGPVGRSPAQKSGS